MPAIVDKIAEVLHLHKHHKHDEAKPVDGSAAPAEPASTSAPPPAAEPQIAAETAAVAKPKTPVFSNDKVTVFYVLGGPGAGKGTQCANLVQDFGFCHLSAGDLLRAEQNRPGSKFGEMIRTYIKEGQVVPMEVTIKLLEDAMRTALGEGRSGEGWEDGKGRFLIDGFPRKMDQAVAFDEEICESRAVLFFTTTEETMTQRLLERGKTSGREDDNEESIKKRFITYRETTMPVIEYYNKKAKVVEIDASLTVDEVHEKAKSVVGDLLTSPATRNVTV